MSEALYLIGALLVFTGGAFSFYFYGVYKGFLSKKQVWLPPFWQIEGQTCLHIVQSPYGKIGGVPNSLSGTIYMIIYGMVLLAVYLGLLPVHVPFIMGLLTLIIGMYLIYGLIRLSTKCVICISVHFINLIVFIFQLILYV